MNPKLFGAIVVVGAALGACKSQQVELEDLATRDQAAPVIDLATSDLPDCCETGTPGCCANADPRCCPDTDLDMFACIPVACVLI